MVLENGGALTVKLPAGGLRVEATAQTNTRLRPHRLVLERNGAKLILRPFFFGIERSLDAEFLQIELEVGRKLWV